MKRQNRAAVGALMLIAFSLAGCSSPAPSPTPTPSVSSPPQYAPAAAARLQAAVLSVTAAASSGDPSAALARLDEVASLAADARAAAEITVSRLQDITASIALVRADLEAAIHAKKDEHGKSGNND